MHLNIQVTVASDDDVVSATTVNELTVATGFEGLDESVAKQDFLTQVETLVRTIAENQIPALYSTVSKRRKEMPADIQGTSAISKMRDKLKTMRGKRASSAETSETSETSEQEQAPDGDTVTCTSCGATIPNDDAHYVAIVRNGKYDHDGVLCDECYKKELSANRKDAARGAAQ